ncbi:Polyferredoxin-like protein (fragment) [Burkholderiales bacterium]
MSSVPVPSPIFRGYRGSRRVTQIAGLLVLVLIPALGIFRIDLATASLMILGYPVYLRDFTVVLGLAIVAATAPLLTYSTIGTVWCGWACPQNTVSEWANNLTHRLLGSRANVNVESAGLQVAPSKNKVRNWAVLGINFLLAALVLGVIPLFYFFPPSVVWSLVSFSESSQFSHFMFRLYLVSVALAFVDIALVRYFWCNYVCLYRFGQLLFKTEDALHVAYDASRSTDCTKCNYCRISCITSIDPTHMKFFDRCVNCGECIDACDRLHAKDGTGTPGLLRYASGRQTPAQGALDNARFALAKLGWHGALFLVGCAVLFYGLTHHAA